MAAPKGNKFAAGGPGGGRPTKYLKSYAKIAASMCELGATDQDLANAFGVSERTIRTWKLEHLEFSAALKLGKEPANENVKRSLYQRAVGFTRDEVEYKVVGGKLVEIHVERYYPPDTQAGFLWLKNRAPDEWRDKQELEVDLRGSLADDLAAARRRAFGGGDAEG